MEIKETSIFARFHRAATGRLDDDLTGGGSAGNVSYGYNLRGWTTSISGTGYSQQLRYNDGPGTPCYNGDISSMTWLSTGDQYLRHYRFTYDGQDRLTEAVYGERDFDKNMNRYDEKVLQYSMNGSVRRLQRRGQKNDGQYGKVDNLTLHYDGNRLVAVEDDAAPVTTYDSFDFRDGTTQAVEYTYNGVGALTSDLNKGITAIAYDNLNNPCRIQFSGGNATEYVYSSDGRKLLTRHITGTAAILSPRLAASPQYVGHDSLVTGQPGILRTIADSTEYVGNAVFLNGQLERLLFPGGYATLDSLQAPVFHYFTQDHLGNVRAVVREDGTVEQVTHYYPFGGVIGDAGSNADLQPYKYNGKELDRLHGLDWYDYGARMYDAQVANWFRVDPLCEKYYHVSPYDYCKNNPIKFIDIEGLYSFENISNNTNYNIVIIMPHGYCDIYGDIKGKAFDTVLQNLKDAPIIYVDNIKDFSNALAYMKENGITVSSYDINSHGDIGQFRIGSEIITLGSDVSALKMGLEGKVVFIDACSVSSIYYDSKYNDLTKDFADQTQANVITSCHSIPTATKYDGKDCFNQNAETPLRNYPEYNKFRISYRGNDTTIIENVRVSIKDGLSWDWIQPWDSSLWEYYNQR